MEGARKGGVIRCSVTCIHTSKCVGEIEYVRVASICVYSVCVYVYESLSACISYRHKGDQQGKRSEGSKSHASIIGLTASSMWSLYSH